MRFGPKDKSYTQPNGDSELQLHDFIWVDVGARQADQVSDLNRVAKVGKATPEQEDVYNFVRSVTLRLAEAIRPGMTGHEVSTKFTELWSDRKLCDIERATSAGRVGHGSGVALTESASLVAHSQEVIQENMILDVEPKLVALGGVFEMEEVIRVTPNGPEFLTDLTGEIADNPPVTCCQDTRLSSSP